MNLVLSLLFLSALPATQTPASGCTCGAIRHTERGLLVWQGEEALRLPEIAELVAPVLWFSPDEPLRLMGLSVPQRHPCDPREDGPVVYYQVRRIRLSGDRRVAVPAEEDPQFFDKVDGVAVRFYFYYEQDFGVRPHRHDLEVVEMELNLETSDGCRALRVRRVTGFAHGTDWYSNELRVEPDTRLPITILVEEGKHASVPDRNADGRYTPGYDVNRRVHDAWGLRDVFGAGVLVVGGFEASMAKPRRPPDRVLPPATRALCATENLSSVPPDEDSLERYVLRPAFAVPACVVPGPDASLLESTMLDHRFGPAYEPDQYHDRILKELSDPLTGTSGILPGFAARFDRRAGMAMVFRGADLRELYLVPKVNWVEQNVGFEALLTRSAARHYSPYLTIGVAREHLPDAEPGAGAEWNPTAELGVKFRLRLEGRHRLFALGYHFAGARFGVRYSGFTEVKWTRIIFEIGPGVW